MKGVARFAWALDEAQEVVHVKAGSRGGIYTCRECGAPVIWCDGPHVTEYFRHKQREFAPGQHCEYRDETYAHRQAKLILRERKWVCVPPVYPRHPPDFSGKLQALRPSEIIEASQVLLERTLYEGPDCRLHIDRPEQPVALQEGVYDEICRPDVVFLDARGRLRLLIEIHVTHQVPELKQAIFRRARVEAIEVTIPVFYKRQQIADALAGYGHTTWLYNHERETSPAVGFGAGAGTGPGADGAGEIPVPGDSVECQLYEIGEAIRSLKKSLGLAGVRTAYAGFAAAEDELAGQEANLEREYRAALAEAERVADGELSQLERDLTAELDAADRALGERRAEIERRVGRRFDPAVHLVGIATAAVYAQQRRIDRITRQVESHYDESARGLRAQIASFDSAAPDSEWIANQLRTLERESEGVGREEESLAAEEARLGEQEQAAAEASAQRDEQARAQPGLLAAEARYDDAMGVVLGSAKEDLARHRGLYDRLRKLKIDSLDRRDADRGRLPGS